jgi:hypothetical protein
MEAAKMKEIRIKQGLVLFCLMLALVVQAFTTSGLFEANSSLQDNKLLIAAYFIGFSFEFSIFIAIYCGSRPAGILFAILSFFVGILFNNQWEGAKCYIDIHNWTLTFFRFPSTFNYVKFVSTTLLQLMNSSLVLIFSELYIKLRGVTDAKRQLRLLQDELTLLEGKRNEQRIRFEKLDVIADKEEKEINEMKKEIGILQDKKTELQEEILKLQKSKGGQNKKAVTA